MKNLLSLCFFVFLYLPVMSQTENTLTLGYNPFKQNYYVELTTKKGDGVTAPFEFRQENKIQYMMSVKWLTVQPDKFTVEVNRISDMVVNEKASDLTVANNLAIRASSALYPLVLTYNTKGKITKVENLEEIQKRWQLLKEKLYQDFEGEGLDRLVDKVGRRLNEMDALIYSLGNDCFLNLFFNSAVYTNYSDKKTTTADIFFPYFQNVMPVKNTLQLKKDVNEQDLIYINFSGLTTDNRSAADLINESDFPYYDNGQKGEGRLTGTYFLNPPYNTIQSVVFFYTLKLEIEKAIMLRIIGVTDMEKPVGDLREIKARTGKIHIPVLIFSDMEKDVQRHLNPLLDIKDMTRPDRKHEGITMW